MGQSGTEAHSVPENPGEISEGGRITWRCEGYLHDHMARTGNAENRERRQDGSGIWNVVGGEIRARRRGAAARRVKSCAGRDAKAGEGLWQCNLSIHCCVVHNHAPQHLRLSSLGRLCPSVLMRRVRALSMTLWISSKKKKVECDRSRRVLAFQETGTWNISEFNVPEFRRSGSHTGLTALSVQASMCNALEPTMFLVGDFNLELGMQDEEQDFCEI